MMPIDMCGKSITVKKRKSHRYTIRFFTGLFAAVPIIILFGTQQILSTIVGCLPFLIVFPMAVYYETWQLRLTQTAVEKSVFGKKTSYSYTQITKAAKRYYASKSAIVIRLEFSDGKALQFRIDDESGEKAEKKLQKHCSINWLLP